MSDTQSSESAMAIKAINLVRAGALDAGDDSVLPNFNDANEMMEFTAALAGVAVGLLRFCLQDKPGVTVDAFLDRLQSLATLL